MSKKRTFNIALGEDGAGDLTPVPDVVEGATFDEQFDDFNNSLTPRDYSFWKQSGAFDFLPFFSDGEEGDVNTAVGSRGSGGTSIGLKNDRAKKQKGDLQARTEKTIARSLLSSDFIPCFKRGLRVTLKLDSPMLNETLWGKLIDDLRVIGLVKGCEAADIYPMACTPHCDDGEMYKPLLKQLTGVLLVRLSILRLLGSRLRQRLQRENTPIVFSRGEIRKLVAFFRKNFVEDSPLQRKMPSFAGCNRKRARSKRLRIDMTSTGYRLLKLKTWQPKVSDEYGTATLATCISLEQRARATPNVLPTETSPQPGGMGEIKLFKISTRKNLVMDNKKVHVRTLAEYPWEEWSSVKMKTADRSLGATRRNFVQMLRSHVGLCAMFCVEQFWGLGNEAKKKFDIIDSFLGTAETWRGSGCEENANANATTSENESEDSTKVKVPASISRGAPATWPSTSKVCVDNRMPLSPIKTSKEKMVAETDSKTKRWDQTALALAEPGTCTDGVEAAYQWAVYESVLGNVRATMFLLLCVIIVFFWQAGHVGGSVRKDNVLNILGVLLSYCWLKRGEQRCALLYARTQLARALLVLGCASTFLFHYTIQGKELERKTNSFVVFRAGLGMIVSYQYSILAPRHYVNVFQAIAIIAYFFVPDEFFSMGQPYAWVVVSLGHLWGDMLAILVLKTMRKRCIAAEKPVEASTVSNTKAPKSPSLGVWWVNRLLEIIIFCSLCTFVLSRLPLRFMNLSHVLGTNCFIVILQYTVFQYLNWQYKVNYDKISLVYSRFALTIPILRLIGYVWITKVPVSAVCFNGIHGLFEFAGAFLHRCFLVLPTKYRLSIMSIGVFGAAFVELAGLSPKAFACTILVAYATGEMLGIWVYHVLETKLVNVVIPFPLAL